MKGVRGTMIITWQPVRGLRTAYPDPHLPGAPGLASPPRPQPSRPVRVTRPGGASAAANVSCVSTVPDVRRD